MKPLVSSFHPLCRKRETNEAGWKRQGNDLETRAVLGNETETNAKTVKSDGNRNLASVHRVGARPHGGARYEWLLTHAAGTMDAGKRPTVLFQLNPMAETGDSRA